MWDFFSITLLAYGARSIDQHVTSLSELFELPFYPDLINQRQCLLVWICDFSCLSVRSICLGTDWLPLSQPLFRLNRLKKQYVIHLLSHSHFLILKPQNPQNSPNTETTKRPKVALNTILPPPCIKVRMMFSGCKVADLIQVVAFIKSSCGECCLGCSG